MTNVQDVNILIGKNCKFLNNVHSISIFYKDIVAYVLKISRGTYIQMVDKEYLFKVRRKGTFYGLILCVSGNISFLSFFNQEKKTG
jgi:hypothetical protein